jgi:hypothetical protein
MNAHSQTPIKKYEKEWKKVEAFNNKKLPQSALAEVKKIYALAKKENQDAQVIKSLLYITGLQAETREDNEAFSIKEIETEIVGAKEPVVSILKNLLASIYWDYFQQHRWQLYDRTQTSGFNKEDIATWDAEDFHKKITELYLQSLSKETLLKQTRLESFDAIIYKGNVRHLRPTLYDLLAHRAISYFETGERDIKKASYAFEMNQASAFDPAADFVTRKFTTKDSFSLEQKALLIYQKLIAFHLNDTKHGALIDVDLQRIEFVRTKSVHPDKDKLYFNAINHIAQQYGSLPDASQAWYLLARYYNEKANEYKPHGDSTHRFDRIKAREICEKIALQKDSSEGKVNCYNLLQTINISQLEFMVEKVNVPNQPFRAFVNYRNFTTLYLRVIPADAALKNQLENRYDDKFWPALIGAKALKNWQQALPATNDLQQHLVEIKIDALPAGDYFLVASTQKDFSNKKAIIGARGFYVSSISFVNNKEDYFVLDRDNGQPLAKAAVQVWRQQYDYKQSKYIKQKEKAYTTDANGFFRMIKTKDRSGYGNYSYNIEVSYGKERLFMDDWMNDYYYPGMDVAVPKTVTSIFLFTDRSIYRPAQTVYFKGITVIKNPGEKTSSLRTGYETKVYLQDANGQKIDSQKVKTNDFGSFSGVFKLPAGGLNGNFAITTEKDEGSIYFKVEEYKRPKFYVEYEPIKGIYKVNDSIKITGIAKAYAGNNIDGATVKYRVVRQPRFLYPWLFWRWWQPPANEMEITHGEITTDKDGKFVVTFAAIPDLSIDKKFEPAFDYTVFADVTDINGETRSGEKMVSVGYKALLLKAAIPESMPADSLQSLSIRTENMNGEFEPAMVNVVITRVKPEQRLIRERYWSRPDQFVMSKEEYISYFPHDEYDNEHDVTSWAKEDKVFDKTDSSKMDGEWKAVRGKYVPGFYMIEMTTKDKNGEEVKDVKYIELFDENSNQLVSPKYIWSTGSNPVEPGEKTTIRLGSAATDIFLVQQLDKDQTNYTSDYSFSKLNNEKRVFNFNPTEADRGGYGVGWLFVKHNRFYQFSNIINVSWKNKELSVEYATYRDKTLPGSEEKWKVKITGYKKEAVAAEMLASMYDASLDQFNPHSWSAPSVWPYYYNKYYGLTWDAASNFTKGESILRPHDGEPSKDLIKQYDVLLGNIGNGSYGVPGGHFDVMTNAVPFLRIRGQRELSMAAPSVKVAKEGAMDERGYDKSGNVAGLMKDGEVVVYNQLTSVSPTQQNKNEQSADVKIRKNFNETAFFFPDLHTDSNGDIEFSFTIPEALTKWKFQALTHTKDMSFGYSSKEIITQKQLMVQPNAPRFLREGDKMEFSSKIVNLTEKEMTGQAELQLIDATTNERVDGWFKNVIPNQYFTIAAGQSESVKFPIEVPYLFNKALVWRIVARSGEFSDGEENAMPVLTNRMLVTESLPLPMRGTGTKNFSFDKLLKSGSSETLQHHALVLEYTSNPAWYAVQALPYLMEYPYDCAEQTWNRYYANSLATFIANSSPRIKQVFEQWKIKDTAALMSNLQKNEELKAVLLEETPWVLQAKNEAEQKKNIALLFDMVRMSGQLSGTYEKLKQMQSSNGGFVWFTGGPDDRYITQYIVTGIGHLKKLNAWAKGQDDRLNEILQSAIPYLDRKIKEDYDNLIKYKTDLKNYTPGYTEIQYLYMRSFFAGYKIPAASQTAYTYFRDRAQKTWTKQNKYMQGMIVLALGRTGNAATPAAILKSLKETSINNEELGMYWKDATRSWWWYEAPIERQALLIEAFQEIGKDTKTADDLRTWLLKNKQTNNWNTTKATAEACYALLLQGTQWLTNEPEVEIKLGTTTIRSTDNKQEAGTGYFKKTIEGSVVKPQMGNITVTVGSSKASPSGGGLEGASPTWGGVYWQYFEDLDKITTAATPLKLVKKLFVEKNTDRGPVLTPVNDGDKLKVGDKIKVRVELRVDRDMEYVHMKDMRASALEPVNVLSSYKWQGGLGYYESTKDASTNFFFSYLRKGTYVFEYPLFVTHAGDFSNGITTIQCMYAPEFSSHSEGVRITVE